MIMMKMLQWGRAGSPPGGTFRGRFQAAGSRATPAPGSCSRRYDPAASLRSRPQEAGLPRFSLSPAPSGSCWPLRHLHRPPLSLGGGARFPVRFHPHRHLHQLHLHPRPGLGRCGRILRSGGGRGGEGGGRRGGPATI